MRTTTLEAQRAAQPALFEGDARTNRPKEAFEARVCAFARAVSLRHRGRTDVAGLLVALRGYHRMLVLFGRSATPALDEGVLQLAIDSYLARTPRWKAA